MVLNFIDLATKLGFLIVETDGSKLSKGMEAVKAHTFICVVGRTNEVSGVSWCSWGRKGWVAEAKDLGL